MILDLTRLLGGEVNKIDIDFELVPEFEDGYNAALDGVEFTSLARVCGCVTDNAGYMRLTLTVSLDYRGECARCLETVDGTLSFEFERTVVSEDTLSRESEDDEDDYSDEYVVLKDGRLDIDGQLREMLVLEFPTKLLSVILCRHSSFFKSFNVICKSLALLALKGNTLAERKSFNDIFHIFFILPVT